MNTLMETMMKSAIEHLGRDFAQKLASSLNADVSEIERLVSEHLESYQPELEVTKSTPKKRQPKEVSPEDVCVARVWGGPCGRQCSKRKASGSDFCTSHGKPPRGGPKWVTKGKGLNTKNFYVSQAWQVHGRVDQSFQCHKEDGTLVWEGEMAFHLPVNQCPKVLIEETDQAEESEQSSNGQDTMDTTEVATMDDGDDLDGDDLDGDELDGDELNSNELDGNELDGDKLVGDELDELDEL